MTQEDHAQSQIPTGPNPFVCPHCNRRAGIVDLGRNVSFCAVCGLEWRGPRLAVSQPPADAAATVAWAESVVEDALRDQ